MILADFETRSRADLKALGGRLYAAHPSTEAICAVLFDTDTQEIGLWLPGDAPPVTADEPIAYHNADGFDRFVAERVGWPKPRTLVDTAHLARRAGLPGALDALGTRWLGIPKDKEGSRFTRSLSTPSRAKARRGMLPEITPAVLARVVPYCASDVEIMAHGWPLLAPYLDLDADALTVDRIVNDRGIAFDRDLAARLLENDKRNAERALAEQGRALGMSAEALRALVSSPAQFCAFTGLEDAQAATLEAVLAHGDVTPPRVRAACLARQALASIAGGKLEAGLLRCSPDGRMRDAHRYYGAHTGRWSGAGMQLQNFPRPSKRFEGWGDAEVCALADGRAELDDEEIVVGLRACFAGAPGNALVVCDFSGVEARGLAWCAGDRDALDVFASGRDPYKTAAAPMFGVHYDDVTKVQRNAGKMAELACGYQGGVNALLRIARGNRFDFATAGVDPADVVASYRNQHGAIVRFWHAMNAAFLAAVRGETRRVSLFEFAPDDAGNVAMFLPSARPIVYNGAGASRGEYGLSGYYQGHYGREHVYGGKLTENAIQAMCRDLMADALVRAEEAGLCPVLHVHDEIVCEVPARAAAEGLEELKRIMLTLPEWAEGFPVGAAGHHGKRYRK